MARDRGCDLDHPANLPMNISIHSLLDGAARAIGTVVAIDVIRATITSRQRSGSLVGHD